MIDEQKRILEVAVKAVRGAGEVLKKYFRQDLPISKKRGIGNIVTIADKESEQAIVKIIRQNFLAHAILGEEGTEVRTDSPYLWSLDSLDGTLPYVNGLPWFAVSIGVFKEEKPYIGVVLLPFGLFGKEELYTAIKGEGTIFNGKKISVSKKTDLDDAVVVFDYGRREREKRIQDFLLPLVSHVRGTVTLQWAAGPLCWIASGIIDGYLQSQTLAHWDIAAATVIIEEAGGKVTDFQGKPIVWEVGKTFDYCASNGKIHDALLALLNT